MRSNFTTTTTMTKHKHKSLQISSAKPEVRQQLLKYEILYGRNTVDQGLKFKKFKDGEIMYQGRGSHNVSSLRDELRY